MTIKSTSRGWEIERITTDVKKSIGIWVYSDTKERCFGKRDRRPCKHCGKEPTKEGYDACLGKIKNAVSACCGHGVREGWVTIKKI